MDDDDLEALISRSLQRKADSLDIGPADWHSAATPHRASRVAIGGVSLALLAAALVGLQFARGSEHLEPTDPAIVPAESPVVPVESSVAPAPVTGEVLNAAAVAQGYGWAASPTAAWTVECLKRAGYVAEYDDIAGSFTFSGPASAQADCVRQLAALASQGGTSTEKGS
jgi:hypothetical protein